jgi:glutamate racemase
MKRIGIFDSGLGGLTVVKEILQRQCPVDIIYLGDTARLPYGTKSQETVEMFVTQDVAFLIQKDIDALVIACHTASAYACDTLKNQLDCPVLDVLTPACEEALKQTQIGKIGVMATQATVASGSYPNVLMQDERCKKISIKACPLMVALAEEAWIDSPISYAIIEKYVSDFLETGIDVLILGCTHFPVFKSVLSDILGDSIRLIDPAEIIAKSIVNLCMENMWDTELREPSLEIFVTDDVEQFRKHSEVFMGTQRCLIQKVNLEVELCLQTLSK